MMSFSMTLKWPITQIVSSERHYWTMNISEAVQYLQRHSYNRILIGTYTRPTERFTFE